MNLIMQLMKKLKTKSHRKSVTEKRKCNTLVVFSIQMLGMCYNYMYIYIVENTIMTLK